MTSDTVEDIWADDKFDREAEAELLADYIRSVAIRDFGREDKRGYTIAVDAPYGFGKSFFLERFAKHMKQTHPVAYVNAWADDVSDDPLAALISTLEQALEPLVPKSEAVKQGMATVRAKAWDITKAIAYGTTRRIGTFALTEAGTAALEEALNAVSSNDQNAQGNPNENAATAKKLIDDALKDAARGLSDPAEIMAERINTYRAATSAIKDVKTEFTSILKSLPENNEIPMVIVIDELDRCRPAYAIKLLEQINHLFDVPGLVFVLGLNGKQFGHAIAGAYGPEFEGQAYLRRFINRYFHLKKPDLTPLLRQLIEDSRVDQTRLAHSADTEILQDSTGNQNFDTAQILAKLMRAYQLDARAAFEVVDKFQTSVALLDGAGILAEYLLPLVVISVADVRGSHVVPSPPDQIDLYYSELSGFNGSTLTNYLDRAQELSRVAEFPLHELRQQLAENNIAGKMAVFKQDQVTAANHFSDPKNYPELIKTVAKFSSQAPEQEP